jgi:hypothetical protein
MDPSEAFIFTQRRSEKKKGEHGEEGTDRRVGLALPLTFAAAGVFAVALVREWR